MKKKLLFITHLISAVAFAQVTVTPASTTICVGETQQISATASSGGGTATLFSENFEDGTLGNFTAVVVSGTATSSQWTNRNSPHTPATSVWNSTIDSGSKFALSNSDFNEGNVNVAMESGVLNTTGYTSLSLTFRHYYSDYSAAETGGDLAHIEISLDGGANWTIMQTYSTTQGSSEDFAAVTLNFNDYLNQTNFKFRLRYKAEWNDGWAVDDVVLSESGTSVTAFTWTPTTGLYTDAAATVPYAGTPTASVYAKPTTTTTYTATYTDGTDTFTGTSVITVTNPAAPVADATQSFCNAATVASLEAEGTVLWYSVSSGGSPLSETTALVNGNSYYASQTVDGCEGTERTTVAVTITTTAAPTVTEATQTFCNAGTVSGLNADGTDIKWYAANTGGTALAGNTVLVNNTSYYASQTVDGCESSERTAVEAQINTVNEPTGDSTQQINADTPEDATIEDIVVTATGTVTWYATEDDALNDENALPVTTQLVSGNTYYATQTIGDCTSITAFEVTVDVVLGNESFDIHAFTYSPNPVKDILTVSYSAGISSITVFNMLGQQVISQQPNTAEAKIDMSGIAPGTYIMNVSSDDTTKAMKIVKE